MKTYELKEKAANAESGEHILGFEESGTHACYMIYGILKPGQKGRLVKPGKEHEEMVLSVTADIEVSGFFSGILKKGSAIHNHGENECFLENKGSEEVVYVIAGGHSEDGHH